MSPMPRRFVCTSRYGSGAFLDITRDGREDYGDERIHRSSLAHLHSGSARVCSCSGFRHAGHLALGGTHDYPLPNLFVSVLQRLGVEADSFATSTGTMRGLEMT